MPISTTQPITTLSVLNRWNQQYPNPTGKRAEIPKKLTTCVSYHGSLDQMDHIIGNRTWTHDTCDICFSSTRQVMAVANDGERSMTICLHCLCRMQAEIIKEPTDGI